MVLVRLAGHTLGMFFFCVGVAVCGDRVLTPLPPPVLPFERMARQAAMERDGAIEELRSANLRVAELEAAGAAVGVWRARAELDAARRQLMRAETPKLVIPVAPERVEDVGPGDLIPGGLNLPTR